MTIGAITILLIVGKLFLSLFEQKNQNKNQNINVQNLVELIDLIKSIKKINKIEKFICKNEFNNYKYGITENLENIILSKGGFHQIGNNEQLLVLKKLYSYGRDRV